MGKIDKNLLWYFESSERVPKFYCGYVDGTNVVVRSGACGARGTVERTIPCKSALAARCRAPDAAGEHRASLGARAKRYRRVFDPPIVDFESLAETAPAPGKAARVKKELPPSVERLTLLLARPEHTLLAKYLTKQRFLKDLLEDETDVELQRPPRKSGTVWQPASAAGVVVFEEPVRVKGNVITAVDGRDRVTLIFLGGLSAKNLFVAPDTDVYCSGPLDVEGLLFAATQDSSLVAFTSLSARVVFGGHGDGWPTVAAGTVTVEVIDDYVEGKGVRASRPKARARDEVKPPLLDEDGDVDREAVLEAFSRTTRLLR